MLAFQRLKFLSVVAKDWVFWNDAVCVIGKWTERAGREDLSHQSWHL
jgi:hypothetical protein